MSTILIDFLKIKYSFISLLQNNSFYEYVNYNNVEETDYSTIESEIVSQLLIIISSIIKKRKNYKNNNNKSDNFEKKIIVESYKLLNKIK